jgi:hypothetical protein
VVELRTRFNLISKRLHENLSYWNSEIEKYIRSTYGEHYAGTDIQVIDLYESLGSLRSTARDKAIKYLSRYGKKDGLNKKDILKTIHYLFMILELDHAPGAPEKP